jgi:hypothetical protein
MANFKAELLDFVQKNGPKDVSVNEIMSELFPTKEDPWVQTKKIDNTKTYRKINYYLNELLKEEQICVSRYGQHNKRFYRSSSVDEPFLPINTLVEKGIISFKSIEKIECVEINCCSADEDFLKFIIKCINANVRNIILNGGTKKHKELEEEYNVNLILSKVSEKRLISVPAASAINIDVNKALKFCTGFVGFREILEKIVRSLVLIANYHKKIVNQWVKEMEYDDAQIVLHYFIQFINMKNNKLDRNLIIELIESTRKNTKNLLKLEKEIFKAYQNKLFFEVDYSVPDFFEETYFLKNRSLEDFML